MFLFNTNTQPHSGLYFPKPAEMMVLEWEQELDDFQKILPPYLKRLLPEIRSRQQPLASLEIAAPITSVIKAKFVSSGTQISPKVSLF